ncbi:MAG: M60 family metallopeptidase [Kistimonas sp.]|nr:M60 family metallopeptidase [Kistimonas sp.]
MIRDTKTKAIQAAIFSLLMSSTYAVCSTPPQEVHQDLMPMDQNFPGSPPANAERISRRLHFAQHPGNFDRLRLHSPPGLWRSTGLYRAPDDAPLTINLHSVTGKRFAILRVGAHKNTPNQHRPERATSGILLPEGIRVFTPTTSGLIYIKSGVGLSGAFDITISGAVKAPWFKTGRDNLAQWQNDIRYYPAPWAELEGRHAILTLPSAMIRDLDDPTGVIAFYDKVVEDVNALMGLSEQAEDARDRAPDLPFRFVLDPAFTGTNINAVSGYPISLNWVAYKDPFVWLTPEHPQARSTLLHELGHNYESELFLAEPPGAQQAFANLINYGYQSREGYWFLGHRSNRHGRYSNDFHCAYSPLFFYLFPFVYGAQPRWSTHGLGVWADDNEFFQEERHAFMIQLVRRLSHEFIADFYREFRHTPENALPDKNDPQARTDYFFETLCKVTHKDLTGFFKNWHVPVSQDAYQRVADKGYTLPAWSGHDGL